ncbi:MULTISPECIES: hypothetical protein [Pseudomonas]|uniref:hypothetical protein n=1 Tax=Pseudomonas TaxID=286 RepID=UPI0015935D84|nr:MULTISPECIES: hypothetical protein [Pseudomonas]
MTRSVLMGQLARPMIPLRRKQLVMNATQAVRVTCGSGFSREEFNAVHGTGCAGVRG